MIFDELESEQYCENVVMANHKIYCFSANTRPSTGNTLVNHLPALDAT